MTFRFTDANPFMGSTLVTTKGSKVFNGDRMFDDGDLPDFEPESLAQPVIVNGPEIPVIEDLHLKVLQAIKTAPDAFDMRTWHGVRDAEGDALIDCGGNLVSPAQANADPALRGEACGTTHCHAGFIVHLAGATGYALEEAVGGTDRAANLIIAKNYPWWFGPEPDYTASNESAMNEIKLIAVRATMAKLGWTEDDLREIHFGDAGYEDE